MSLHKLSTVAQKFVLHWGEMGTRWGINRTVAQVHALLFLAEKPLPAEEIADTLGIARSNASTSLRDLQNWGIVKIVHLAGDRRDHFQSMKDVFAMFRVIARERKKREIDPTIHVLRDCIAEVGNAKTARVHARAVFRFTQFSGIGNQRFRSSSRSANAGSGQALEVGRQSVPVARPNKMSMPRRSSLA